MTSNFTYTKQYFEKRRFEMNEEFNSIKPDLQELADYLLPRMSRFLVNDINKPIKKSKKIVDSCPLIAVKNFASGMQSGATSVATRWFKSQINDERLMRNYEIQKWCYFQEELTRRILQKSNFYQLLLGAYKQLGVFGFACMSMDSDYDTVVNFRLLPMGSYCVSKNWKGDVDTVCRNYQEKAKNIVQKYGEENCSQEIIEASKNTPEKYFELVHFVEPNKEKQKNSPLSKHKEYISVVYQVGADKIISKAGFDRFPYAFFESETNGEDTYPNSCPAIDALPDIKQLFSMVKEYGKAVKKLVTPPYKGPAALKNKKISDAAGMFTEEDENGRGLSPVYEINARVLELKQEINEIKETIKTHFYNDLFAVIMQTAERGRTATEVNEIKEEKMVLLSPLLDQIHKTLRVILDWIFFEELETGILPQPPEEVQGKELEMEFISTLAQAQKAKGLAALERFTTFTVNLAQAVDPTVAQKLNADKIVESYGSVANINPEFIKPEEELEEIRKKLQEQQEQQKQLEAFERGSKMIQNIGGIDAVGSDLLSRTGLG